MSATRFRSLYPAAPWLWLCEDMPVSITRLILEIEKNAYRDVVVSTQVPVGTTTTLARMFPERRFAYIPENFRGDSYDIDRLVIGAEREFAVELARYFAPIPCLFMSAESAEIVKHSLNGFLAVSIEYAHEIAALAEKHGADPDEVARGLMSDPRIGFGAYLSPDGEPGPHLAREVANLKALGGGPVIDALP